VQSERRVSAVRHLMGAWVALSTLACAAADPPAPTVVSAPTVVTVPTPAPKPASTATLRAPAGESVSEEVPALQRARIENARVEAEAMAMAVELWQLSRPDRCPTHGDLINDKTLDDRPNQDPWKQPYAITCGEGVTVSSSGPDARAGTKDDVTVERR
jgi:hypothetical protein